MPDWEIILAVVGIIFSAGVTWGIMTARQKSSEKTTMSAIDELKSAVGDLKGLVVGWKLLEASDKRNTDAIDSLEKRVIALEIDVALLKSSKASVRNS